MASAVDGDMVMSPEYIPRPGVAGDFLCGRMACDHIYVVEISDAIIRPLPHQISQRVVLNILFRAIIAQPGVDQQIVPAIDGQFLIDGEFLQEIDHGFLHFPAQPTEFLNRGAASVILPCHKVLQRFLIQFPDGHVRDLLHEEPQALQRHELMIARQAHHVGHLHEHQQRPDGMGAPVQDIPQDV